jgi:hypothetical protein
MIGIHVTETYSNAGNASPSGVLLQAAGFDLALILRSITDIPIRSSELLIFLEIKVGAPKDLTDLTMKLI